MASAVKDTQAAIRVQAIRPGRATALGEGAVLWAMACQADWLWEKLSIEVRRRVP